MLDGVRKSVHNLADNGFAGKAIQRKLAEKGHHFSVSYIYKVCHWAGIHIMDYRRGDNDRAKAILKRVAIPEPLIVDKPVHLHKKKVRTHAKGKARTKDKQAA